MQEYNEEPIAVVGMACRFPGGAHSPQQFWQVIAQGTDAIIDVPADRWNAARFYHPDPEKPGKMYVRQGGFLQQPIDAFDATFFNITPREAERLDPQQRILLEVAQEAFEDAGMVPTAWSGSNTGVYIGAFTMDNMGQKLSFFNRDNIMSHTGMSTTMVMLSNRLSYIFNLHGQSLTVDTACSSSLVSLHLACQALRHGECDVALSGGVNIMFRPEFVIAMCKGHFLSPEMRSKTFDATADGYVRGEGAGLLVLKPLSRAQADGDRIHAVITATGVNQDGRTDGITLPNQRFQVELIREVWAKAGIKPDDISYFEAHGTGTQAGDVTESGSLGEVLVEREEPCPVGSVKANIGHLEAAAGVAGVIKAILMLQQQAIPPQIHLTEVNPKIDLNALNLRVPLTLESGQDINRIAVNSFGYGGTNAHALLEAAPEPKSSDETAAYTPAVYLYSARSEASLTAQAERQADFVQDDVSLTDYAYSLAHHRDHHEYRLGIVAQSAGELRESLRTFAASEGPSENILYGEMFSPQPRKLVFVYTGMGAQSLGMGRDLLHSEPVFRETVEEIDQLFQRQAGWSLMDLFEDTAGTPISQPAQAQPANFALQIGLTRLWANMGVVPEAVIGHSVGEIAAAVTAGTLSLEAGVRLVYHRSRLQQQTLHEGGMLAVALSEADVQPWLNDQVSLAAINSATSVTLAGAPDALNAIAAELEARGIFNRLLRVDVAYHSYQMAPLEADFMTSLRDLTCQPPNLPLYSTVYGTRLNETILQDTAYWWKNCRQPVLLARAVGALIEDGCDMFVEIGPHPVLAAAIREGLQAAGKDGVTVPSIRRGQPSMAQLHRSLATLYTQGYMPNLATLYPGGRMLTLPGYAWEHTALWNEPDTSRQDRVGVAVQPILQFREFSAERVWRGDLDSYALDFLRDHRIEEQPLFPASAYLETGLEMLAQGDYPECNTLADWQFLRLLNLDYASVLEVHDDGEGNLTLSSRAATEAANWALNAQGRIITMPLPPRTPQIDVEGIRRRGQRVEVDVYALLAERKLTYGERFQLLADIYRDGDALLARIPQPANSGDFFMQPAVMDAGFQLLVLTLDITLNPDRLYLPVGVRELRYHGRTEGDVWCYGRLTHAEEALFEGDIIFCDAAGNTLVEVLGLQIQAQATAGQQHETLQDRLYSITYELIESLPEQAIPAGQWLVLGDPEGLAQHLDLNGNPCRFVTPAEVYTNTNGSGATLQHDALERIIEPLRDDLVGVIYLWGAESTLTGGANQADAGITQGLRLLHVMQALIRLDVAGLRLVAVVTNGSQAVPDASAVRHPGQMVLWGLGRVFANEYLAACVTLVDLDPDAPVESMAKLMPLALYDCAEPEMIIRQGAAYVNRFDHFVEQEPLPQVVSPDTPARLQVGQPGLLDSLHFQATTRTDPGPDEVEIQVRASALNFKDVMKVLNLLPEAYLEKTYFGNTVGLEFAGEIVRVGENVREYRPGDSVVGMSIAGGFRTYTTAPVQMITHLPDAFSAAESVMFTNFITAYYSLHEVAHLQPGERVLIHSASGGVGLAAIQVAHWLGAEVLATAGTEDKRAFLRNMGLDYVSDSRSLRFVDDVRRWTDGAGVDVVLNTLTGEALRQSFELLAPFGRFVEIGKKDIIENKRLAMAAFDRNLTFATVDIDLMAQERPQKLRDLLDTLREMFNQKQIKPLPLTVYPASEISDAFRLMSQSRHTGKIVVTMGEADLPVYPDPQRTIIQPDRTYLVTGGFGGFGLETARWLVAQGARYLALASRSGPKDANAQAALRDFEAAGVQVLSVKADVAQPDAVAQLLHTIRETLPPLGGVIHSAMVLDDALLIELTPERLGRVLAPKVMGAWQLHLQTLSDPLDFFLMFSSISAVIGNPRQGNYVAANAFMDGLAHYRQAQGLPALSVNLGPLSEIGVVARNPKVEQYLSNMGLTGLAPDRVMESLDYLLRQPQAQVSVVDVNWQQWLNSSMVGAESPRYRQLTTQVQVKGVEGHGFLGKLNSTPSADREALVVDFLVEQFAKVTRLPAKQLNPALSFDRIGLDSLMVLELNNLIRVETGQEFSVVTLSQSPTIAQMATHLLQAIGNGNGHNGHDRNGAG